jgi:peptidoglycan-associated lipoprotein
MKEHAMHRNALLALITACAVLSACASKAPKDLPPDPGPARTSADTANGSSQAPVPGSQADFAAFTLGLDTIYFDTDRYNLDVQDIAALQRQVQWLIRYPAKRATIEGHCDERGTREYNLALGERRAEAARSYLAGQGIDSGRLSTVSYGKERPLELGSDEASWAKNRRAVTVTID